LTASRQIPFIPTLLVVYYTNFAIFVRKKAKNKQKFKFFSKIGLFSIFSPSEWQQIKQKVNLNPT